MRSVRSKFCFLFLWVVGILMAAQALQAEEKADLAEIKTRLATIEEQQKEVLANQKTIFEKLDQLRIWVHRK